MAAPSNTFAKVSAPDREAVTVTIRQQGAKTFGLVQGPSPPLGAQIQPIALGEDGSLGPHQALAVACQLANELGREVVVIDEGANWRPDWGRLEPA
jgi:hypothetical protein